MKGLFEVENFQAIKSFKCIWSKFVERFFLLDIVHELREANSLRSFRLGLKKSFLQNFNPVPKQAQAFVKIDETLRIVIIWRCRTYFTFRCWVKFNLASSLCKLVLRSFLFKNKKYFSHRLLKAEDNPCFVLFELSYVILFENKGGVPNAYRYRWAWHYKVGHKWWQKVANKEISKFICPRRLT